MAVKINLKMDVCWVKLLKTQEWRIDTWSYRCSLPFESSFSSDCSVHDCAFKQEGLHLHFTRHMLGIESKLVSRLPLQSMEKNSYVWRAGNLILFGHIFFRLQDDLVQICEQWSDLSAYLSTLTVKVGAGKCPSLLILFH